MVVLEPSVEILNKNLDGVAMAQLIEEAGRTCYKSEDKITEDSYDKFIRGIIKRGHESVIEHSSITVRITTDRGVTHEIVRHRIASYSQESTRYCNYGTDKFGGGIAVIRPSTIPSGTPAYNVWLDAMHSAEDKYMALLANGCTPQQARAVLPNSLKTEIVMTTNIREWRHFFTLRCAPAAHPDMREVALLTLALFHENIPLFFDDLYEQYKEDIEKL